MNRIVVLLILISQVAFANEAYDRKVDAAALSTQDYAIQELQKIVKKSKGSEREENALFRLAEATNDSAELRFRIEQARGGRTENYLKRLKTSIEVWNQFLARFPSSEWVSRALYRKAQAHLELEQKMLAKESFLKVVQKFPLSKEAESSWMSLADGAIEENQHAEAITYLDSLEARPKSPYYPIALYKLAWAHYNLKRFRHAIDYLEKNISYYNNSALKNGNTALRETAQQDLVLFYFEGKELEGTKNFSTAYEYFQKWDTAPHLGKMYLRYSKLLRSRGYGESLHEWTRLILEKDSALPEVSEIFWTAFEDVLNKRQFATLKDYGKLFLRLTENNPAIKTQESFGRFEKYLAAQIVEMRSLIQKNKEATQVQELVDAGSDLNELYFQLHIASDLNSLKIRSNWAETLFQLKKFATATDHYRWVFIHCEEVELKKEASLRAIASRYEELKESGLISKNIQATSLMTVRKGDSKILGKLLEWKEWIDLAQLTQPEFDYELNRSLYVNVSVKEATDRMFQFVKRFPKSPEATGGLSLIVDTAIATQDWNLLLNWIVQIEDMKLKLLPTFAQKIRELKGDSEFKIAEGMLGEKKTLEAQKAMDSWIQKYPTHPKRPDALVYAIRLSIEKGNLNDAERQLGVALVEAPEGLRRPLLWQRALIREKNLDLEEAASDLREWLKQTLAQKAKFSDDERKRLLVYSWGFSMPGVAEICANLENPECERITVLSLLRDKISKKEVKQALNNAKEGVEENRALWAMAAFRGARDHSLHFRDRLRAMKYLGQSWAKLDPMVQFSVASDWTAEIQQELVELKNEVNAYGPLKADPTWIAERVKLVRDTESSLSTLTQIPRSNLQLPLLQGLYETYDDLATRLSKLNLTDELKPEIAQVIALSQQKMKEFKKMMDTTQKQLAMNGEGIAAMVRSSVWNMSGSVENRIEKLIKTKKLREASVWLAISEKFEKLSPESALLYRGYALLIQGANYEALSLFREARKEHPQFRAVGEVLYSYYCQPGMEDELHKLSLQEEGRSCAKNLAQKDLH